MRQEAEFSIRLFGPAILLHPEGGRRRSKECKLMVRIGVPSWNIKSIW
jgi:hypothetical protein